MSEINLPALSRPEEFARAALSEASLRAYRADWAHFLAWYEATGRQRHPASAETVFDYPALVEFACDLAKEADCDTLELMTNLTRTDAHKFYGAIGFHRSTFRFYRSVC